MTRLVLIDGHAILHRAYHALPPLISRTGQPTGAVYGFLTMLFRIIQDLKPTHLAAAFDLPTPTFRHEAYIAYQAQRPPTEQALKDQIELVKEVLVSAGTPIYACPGFEADDVIGTLAEQAVRLQPTGYSKKEKNKKAIDRRRKTVDEEVDEVIIVTGDRDIMQLVNHKVKVYAPIRGLSESKMFGKVEVEEYMGVKPSQIVDYKALVGDQSDNYPGVAGIGPKTAVELIKSHDNLDGVYRAIGVKGFSENITKKLEDGKAAAKLSQNLARIRVDAPVRLDLKRSATLDLSKNEKFLQKLDQLGFKSLIKRLTGEEKKRINSKIEKTQISLL